MGIKVKYGGEAGREGLRVKGSKRSSVGLKLGRKGRRLE